MRLAKLWHRFFFLKNFPEPLVYSHNMLITFLTTMTKISCGGIWGRRGFILAHSWRRDLILHGRDGDCFRITKWLLTLYRWSRSYEMEQVAQTIKPQDPPKWSPSSSEHPPPKGSQSSRTDRHLRTMCRTTWVCGGFSHLNWNIQGNHQGRECNEHHA